MFFCCFFCSSWYTRVYEYTIHLCVPNTFVNVCVCLTQALRQKRYKNKFNILRFVCVRCVCVRVCAMLYIHPSISLSQDIFSAFYIYMLYVGVIIKTEENNNSNKIKFAKFMEICVGLSFSYIIHLFMYLFLCFLCS